MKMTTWMQEESVGGFSFRVRPSSGGYAGYYAEAVRGQFSADDILNEPADRDCWFEFGSTPDATLASLKSEVLQNRLQ